MTEAIKGLEPQLLWKHFYKISQIPHCSKEEKQLGEYIVQIARQNGLEYRTDAVGNIAVRKPPKAGLENGPTIVLQSHLDMVCEKNKDVKHDFSKDPIALKKEDDWIKADGTTLGADNGIGVATALAIMEEGKLDHGALELLFTVDEETGLTGAIEIPGDMLDGRILLNLDSEEDGVFYNGCAGGKDAEISLNIEAENVPAGYKPVSIKVTGLTGGHSGLNIHEGRGNAIKLLNRFLWKALEKINLRLASFEGGNKHNAIPREAYATIFLPDDQFAKLHQMVEEFNHIFKDEYMPIDTNVNTSIEESGFEIPDTVFTSSLQKRLIDLLYSLPHGAITMSNIIPEVVETSNNLAVVKCTNGQINILTSQRSMSKSKLADIHDMVRACSNQAGAELKSSGGYPAWQPNPNSPLLQRAKSVYRKLFGSEPKVKAIHAGLECGIIGDKFPGMDMISFGPTIEGTHSPDERVQISTMGRFWKLVTALLKNYAT